MFFPIVGTGVCPRILLRTVSLVIFKIVCVFVYMVLLMLTVEAQRTWKLFPECLNNKIYRKVWQSLTLVSLFSGSLVLKVFILSLGKRIEIGFVESPLFLEFVICFFTSQGMQRDKINLNQDNKCLLDILKLIILSVKQSVCC